MSQPKLRSAKVCVLANYGAPYGGNFISCVRVLQKKLSRAGGTLELVLPQRARSKAWVETLRADGVPVSFLPERGALKIFLSTLLRIWKSRADVVHTHFTAYDVSALLAARIAGLVRPWQVAVIWHIHSDFPVKSTLFRKLKDFIKYRLLGRSAYIIAVSDHLKIRPVAAGFKEMRIMTIRNGIDFGRLDVGHDDSGSIGRVPLEKESTVLMFGWSPYVKGFDVAVAAFEILRGSLSLMVVGREDTLKVIAQKYPHGIPPWLHLVPPVENVTDYFAQADVFLSASRREGFPYSIYEAMACGCLVITSEIPAVSWMKGVVRCWWFESEDPSELAKRILECMALSMEERQRVRESNSAIVRANLSAETWANELIAAYGRIGSL